MKTSFRKTSMVVLTLLALTFTAAGVTPAQRDDERWLKHTLAWHTAGGTPRLDEKPVTIDTWKPVERKY